MVTAATCGQSIKIFIAARASLASVATHDLEPWGVYAGVPAKKIKERERTGHANKIAASAPPRA